MTFKEKSAWVMSLALLVSGAFYMLSVISRIENTFIVPPPNGIGIWVGTIIIVAIAIFGHAVAALGNPANADEPEDERDRVIAQRTGAQSGFILGALSMINLAIYAVLQYGHVFFHGQVMALVISQFTQYMLIIFSYRRGA